MEKEKFMTGNFNSSASYKRNAFRRQRSEESCPVRKGIEVLDIAELIARKRALMQARAC